ncbi:MAG TPA: hypothetical protein VHG89_00895 [Verrucomicrobiae bacterium]|nr:hypothetical protein [Verrucomicrobiae bacterium]
MKTKILLMAALLGAATLSANAGVRLSFSFGLPIPVIVTAPVAPVAVAAPAAPVVVATAPVVTAPVIAPTTVVSIPACPGPGYVWIPGYWSVNGYSRVWISGCWQYRPTHVVYGYPHGWHRW